MNKFEEYCRDKLITELFIQKFIIYKSDILIIVIGIMTLNEQQLLARIKKEAKNKQIYVVHNLQNYQTHEQVKDYIENTLKNWFECWRKYLSKIFKKWKRNWRIIIVKLMNIIINQLLIFLKKKIVKKRQKFSIINECKKFLKDLSEEIIEEKINENSISVEEIDDNNDKICIQNQENITLKKFMIDEMGYILWRKNKKFIITYSRLLFIYIWRTSKWRYWNWRRF